MPQSLTVDEAKQVWCRHSTTVYIEGSTKGICASPHNRGVKHKDSCACYCVASNCAAWTWDDPQKKITGYCGAEIVSMHEMVKLVEGEEVPLARRPKLPVKKEDRSNGAD